jgi:hypothetical protein
MRTAKFPKTTCVSVDPPTYARIKHSCDQKKESMAEIMRGIITRYFAWEDEAEQQVLINKQAEELSGSTDNFNMSLEEMVREPSKGTISK